VRRRGNHEDANSARFLPALRRYASYSGNLRRRSLSELLVVLRRHALSRLRSIMGPLTFASSTLSPSLRRPARAGPVCPLGARQATRPGPTQRAEASQGGCPGMRLEASSGLLDETDERRDFACDRGDEALRGIPNHPGRTPAEYVGSQTA
jgi:hypothetical protein